MRTMGDKSDKNMIKIIVITHVIVGVVDKPRIFFDEKLANSYINEFLERNKPESWNTDVNGTWDIDSYNNGSDSIYWHENSTPLDVIVSGVTVYNKDDAKYLESVNELANAGRSLYYQHGVLVRFIQEYFSRYDIELACLDGVDLESMPVGNLVQLLDAGNTIMTCISNIRGVVDSTYGRS